MKKRDLHWLIYLVILLGIPLAVRPTGSLTQLGVYALAITVSTLYAWLTIGSIETSLLYMVLMIVVGVLGANDVWVASFGNSVFVTILVFVMLSECLKETGVIGKIANWFISRKLVKGRPYMFLGMFFLSNLAIGMFVENMSLAIIYIELAKTICSKVGAKKGDPFYTCMFMGILWCNTVISIASPIAHAPVVLLMSMLETQVGVSVSFAQWFLIGIPFTAVMLLIMMLCVALWKPNAPGFQNLDIQALAETEGPLRKEGKIALGVFLTAIFFTVSPEFLQGVFPAFTAFMARITTVIPAMCAVIALAVVRSGGKPILNIRTATKAVPLGALIFGGAVVAMSTPLSRADVGVTAWMGESMKPLVGSLPPVVIILILVILAVTMTNFLSNVVTMVVFFNIGISVLPQEPLLLAVFGVCIGFASSMATLTPSASIPAPLFFGEGHVTMQNTFKYNMVFVLCAFAAVMLVIYPLSQLVV